MIKLDSTDHKILELLQENANLTTKEIAAELGLSNTPTYERIKRLQRHRVILKSVALIDRKQVQCDLIGFCNVSLDQHSKQSLQQFERDILSFKEILECYHITGKYDYMLKVAVKDMEAYHKFTFNHLATLENVGNVHTIFVMKDIKYSTAYPIPQL